MGDLSDYPDRVPVCVDLLKTAGGRSDKSHMGHEMRTFILVPVKQTSLLLTHLLKRSLSDTPAQES